MNTCDDEFWSSLDKLVDDSEIVIDRPKGSSHPKYPNFIYRLNYGYLKNTASAVNVPMIKMTVHGLTLYIIRHIGN